MLVQPEGTSAAAMYRQNRVAKYLILNIFEKDAEFDEKRRKKKGAVALTTNKTAPNVKETGEQ